MTFKYNNVYINEVSTITGPKEGEGPLSKFFDKSYSEYYMGSDTWEQAEIKMNTENIDLLLNKSNKSKKDVDIFISGDLLNQIVASSYAASTLNIPYMGIYSACATSTEGIIIASNMIEGGLINNSVVNVSSHNNASEKQFRYPVEYGGPKPVTQTFTVTGSASALISNKKSNIKVESATLGKCIDSGVKNVFDMGSVMAIAAADTIDKHLKDTKREIGYYDLILTGDLGMYGKNLLKDVLKDEYGYDTRNVDDSACMIYDINKQSVYAGGSGPACIALVTYSYILNLMRQGKLNRVLMVATGALMNPTMVNQKLSIPSIAHAVSLEVIS
ncbi:MAG: stage V sporulation protein AD [Tenericutes bacterium]|nr:stage V sporulation protein AD [Mycoplasmatota bacterium]